MNPMRDSESKQDKPGIAIVAPGGYAPDSAAVERAIEGLREAGHLVRCYYRHEARHQRFGGSDVARLAQLHEAACDPDVKIILALRGGYGSSRLLQGVDFGLLADSGKLLVGHSDITALQLGLLARTGGSSFAGPVICDDFTREDRSDYAMQNLWACLEGPRHQLQWQAAGNAQLEVEGLLWGGNLAMLTHLAGTPYLPRVPGGILFLEDVNEHPYRVERMLLQLLHAGILEQQQALVLGDFGQVRLTDYENGYGLSAMLDYLRETLPIPIVTGLPFGHIRDKATLAVGAQARLVSGNGQATLDMWNYLSLSSSPL
jgi:muramoyltetrapeptide carboxypeptidase